MIKFRSIFSDSEIQKDNAFIIKIGFRVLDECSALTKDITERPLVESDRKFNSSQYVRRTMNRLAGQLLDPSSGDIVFSVQGANGERKSIYAWKHILAAASEYFEARTYFILK